MSEAYHNDPWSSGGRAGRWNHDGVRMIYLASTPSLAMLEYLTIKGSVVGQNNWYMITFEIMDEHIIDDLEAESLPDEWNLIPHPFSTRQFGSGWVKDIDSTFLRVPSARIPIEFYSKEHNLLVNANHSELKTLMRVISETSFSYSLGMKGTPA
ncbi:MAG TPA: RES family NAD+ phosphorylase [Chryseosolibacter sp.]|nr:RES family NAD+ phosphorylase [Chryseosolibacter sp.]